jgi:hypothetical protein
MAGPTLYWLEGRRWGDGPNRLECVILVHRLAAEFLGLMLLQSADFSETYLTLTMAVRRGGMSWWGG